MTKTAHSIVVGNEKGGTGKSTTAMHVIVALLKEGFTVGAIDLDARQGTLSRYIANRAGTMKRRGIDLPMPESAGVVMSDDLEADREKFYDILRDFAPRLDFLVMDCPGHDNPVSRLAHNLADTLITPLNDSFIDLDNLADVDPETYEVRKPSRYAEIVWEERKRRMLRDRKTVDWIVLRNRLSQLDAKNKRRVGDVLERLKDRIGYRVAPGLSERVIYRELFLEGLTLLDVLDDEAGVEANMSHLAARQELRALMDALKLPGMPSSDAG